MSLQSAVQSGDESAEEAQPARLRACFGKKNLRDLLAIDEREPFVLAAQTWLGQLVIFLVTVLAVSSFEDWWQAALLVGLAMAYARLPRYRNCLLLGGTWTAALLALCLSQNAIQDNIRAMMAVENVHDVSPLALGLLAMAVVFVGACSVLALSRRDKTLFVARRPMLALLGVEAVLCGLCSLSVIDGLPRVLLWSLLIVFTPYLWFLAYALADQRSRDASPPIFQMGVLRPFWSPTFLPFGKGAAFLRKTFAKSPEDLAVTQIKGVKLLLWANVLLVIKIALVWVFQEQLQVPGLEAAQDAFLAGQSHSLPYAWAAVILSTAKFSLQIAFWGHLFIGVARLAGFRLPRSTWRPLGSKTLMEYFNRFHYYFKELLVDFFFVPTFFKMFRGHPRLRLFFATFMAAGVGNAIWHFIRDIDLIATIGLGGALVTFESYAFYCLVLATGLGLSQVRMSMGFKPSLSLAGRLRSFLFVWSFVVCLHIFSDGSRSHSIGERLAFLGSLFGVI
ncbi:MAG: hypothetical protein CRU78_03060 [Candidatus Accumulibacter phosphatis]|uniref:Uncharacterized protein n=1 Tax=Candidatus Accumulibacter phosphatis TaxID=327160 RepID=A0A6A7RQ10_9PROT|nr:hypothetical protein [Candidatus Accumulibacter phosphatis]